MKKPIIAITSSTDLNPDRLNDNRTLVSLDYSDSIINSGGIPVILPITDNLEIIKKILHLSNRHYCIMLLSCFYLLTIPLKSIIKHLYKTLKNT